MPAHRLAGGTRAGDSVTVEAADLLRPARTPAAAACQRPRLRCSTVVLISFACPAITVCRFVGVWQQESGKGPRLANGAAKLRTRANLSYSPPWRALLGRPDPLGSRLLTTPSAGKSGVGGERGEDDHSRAKRQKELQNRRKKPKTNQQFAPLLTRCIPGGARTTILTTRSWPKTCCST